MEVGLFAKALRACTLSGKRLGWPKGSSGVSHRDGKEDDIRNFQRPGVSKNAIANMTGMFGATPYRLIYPTVYSPVCKTIWIDLTRNSHGVYCEFWKL